MNKRALCVAVLGVSWSLGSTSAWAQAATSRGEQVYRQVCAACHAEGVAGAPRMGDAKAWKPLTQEGQHVLTGHAFVGVRAMPPQGGKEDLGLEDFSRAVAWMARNSGGDWKDPDAAMMHKIREQARKRLDTEIRKKQALRKRLAD